MAGFLNFERFFRSYARFTQIFIGRFRSGKKIISNRIGYHPVYFFRHCQSPERIPPSTCATLILFSFFAVMEQAIVEVTANNQNQIRPVFLQYFFIAYHNSGGLLCLCSAARFQVNIRLRNSQLFKKAATHFPVIMLAGMYKPVADILAQK
jgi:hypothetical protein